MNNLKELFEIQAGLDAEILNNHPVQPGEDRLEKKHAALLVELGEMFNEWRAFKFWSTDQTPRKEIKCTQCVATGKVRISFDQPRVNCPSCKGKGIKDKVLGELVDCLHFVMSIGIEHGLDKESQLDYIKPLKWEHLSKESHFIELMMYDWSGDDYIHGLRKFIGFTELLGYTWEQITAAYLEKNQENHYRQMNGY